MKIKWKSLFNAFLTAIASGAGKWVIGLIITSFMVVLVVLPVVQSPKRAVPQSSETSTPAREPTAAELPTAAPPAMAPPLAAPPMAPPMAAPPAMSDSAAACVGLRSWQARHTSDSLTPALQAALKRMEVRCGMPIDSVKNIPR